MFSEEHLSHAVSHVIRHRRPNEKSPGEISRDHPSAVPLTAPTLFLYCALMLVRIGTVVDQTRLISGNNQQLSSGVGRMWLVQKVRELRMEKSFQK